MGTFSERLTDRETEYSQQIRERLGTLFSNSVAEVKDLVNENGLGHK